MGSTLVRRVEPTATQLFLDTVPFETVRPSKRQVLQAAQYSALKDAPIVAAAKRAQVDYLVSLDRRHLVGVPEVAQRSGLKIVLLVSFWRKYTGKQATIKGPAGPGSPDYVNHTRFHQERPES